MAQRDIDADAGRTAGRDAAGRAQFAAQYEAAYRVLWLIAVGIVSDEALAEDVVQEAAIIALEKYGQFAPGSNFTAWMGQMVRNVALNQGRRQRRRRGVRLDDLGAEPSRPGGGEEPFTTDLRITARGELPADQSVFDDRLMFALESVAPLARACLLLRTLEGLEYSDISDLLSIPEGTAMSHVHRARQHLRQQLADLEPPPSNRKGPAS